MANKIFPYLFKFGLDGIFKPQSIRINYHILYNVI